jgi:hypothetical protein
MPMSPVALAEKETLRAEKLCDLGELMALRQEWRALWERCPDASPFQSDAWLLPWWRAYRPATPPAWAFASASGSWRWRRSISPRKTAGAAFSCSAPAPLRRRDHRRPLRLQRERPQLLLSRRLRRRLRRLQSRIAGARRSDRPGRRRGRRALRFSARPGPLQISLGRRRPADMAAAHRAAMSASSR